MKKLICRLSSSPAFAKLFSLLACVALGCLFAQQAVAQDFFFGWEPFPPSSWDGGWDASLKCEALDGTTTLTRTPPKKSDTHLDHGSMMGASVDQEGRVNCTFTDPNNKTCGFPNCNPITGFKETASCLLSFEWRNLKEECVNNDDGSSTLTVTGQCPFKPEKGYTIVEATLEGTIDCRGRNPDGKVNLKKNPEFCSYQGNDPDGNPTQDCRWNVGFGAEKQIQGPSVASFVSNVVPVVPLTQQQCNDAFGDSPQISSATHTQTPTVFSLTQTFAGRACMGPTAGAKGPEQKFCHSDTWNSKQDPFCNFSPTSTQTIGTSFVQSSLIADTEYTPKTINAKCNRHDDDDEVITLTVLANAVDPGTNDVALEEINQKTITVNGRPIIQNSCRFDKFSNLTCKVKQCVKGESIIAETIDVKARTATLFMEACIGNVINGTCDGTPVVGDVETILVRKKDHDKHDDKDD